MDVVDSNGEMLIRMQEETLGPAMTVRNLDDIHT